MYFFQIVVNEKNMLQIFNLERIAIAESNRERSLNQRKNLTALKPFFRSCNF